VGEREKQAGRVTLLIHHLRHTPPDEDFRATSLNVLHAE
jgi:hypothetical protein